MDDTHHGNRVALLSVTPLLGKEITGRHHAGDRVTVHGVTLFGQVVHYEAHIHDDGASAQRAARHARAAPG